ncbi:flagellar biosynthesis protein [Maritimibacter sp. UBA3975]|uniref:FliH/SctL family protein n=1 Tax=Maritimibacter sp. UBA3975 TaxID=1946833 RepID=UPI000C0949D1|nr:flagellar biosynthesis protein [Maritimibacter sp. UBA3975]MAM61863.1 flagellar biosynthesis protein [Maritimibacter sp.]|tara:strand:- start:19332 stop:19970 length:639 start_codon:yes stop_codon:yes gene_type:complete
MTRVPLEDFGTESRSAPPNPGEPVRTSGQAVPQAAPSAEDLEKARLAGYEVGYQAGWDDAARSEAEDKSRIGAEFARNLQDLGFTFHEARAHVMQALEPLLAGMVEKVLPRLVSETLGQTIIEELMPLAANAADAPIEVVVTPESRPLLENMLDQATSVPFRIVEEATLAEGQVYLRTGKLERRIDMSQAVDRIGSAIQGLYQLNEKAFENG